MSTRTALRSRAAAAVTAAGVVLAGTLISTTVPAAAAQKRVETPFVYQGAAYGTRFTVGGENGQLSSGRIALSTLGCTTLAPVKRTGLSDVARLDQDSFIEVGAVTSDTGSYRRPKLGRYGTVSTNRMIDLQLGADTGNASTPRLRFGGLRTTAHAWNTKGRFDSSAAFRITDMEVSGDIAPEDSDTPGPLSDLLDQLDDGVNSAVLDVLLSAPGQQIDVPGVGTLHLSGKKRVHRSRSHAGASAFGLRIELDNGSELNIGRAWARIEAATAAGIFAGSAYGVESTALDGALGIGRQPVQPLPCTGTNGRWTENTAADLDIPGVLSAEALNAETFGMPRRDGRAVARARATVTGIVVAGQLRIDGVVAQANVVQRRNGTIAARHTNGTTIGSISYGGQTYAVPAPGESPLVIDGVASVKSQVVKRLGKRGIRVHALQVTLLDTAVVLNIGTASASIRSH